MNLLADENVDQPIVQRLRQDGHDVLYIAELGYSEKNNHPKIGDNGETIRWFFIDKPNG